VPEHHAARTQGRSLDSAEGFTLAGLPAVLDLGDRLPAFTAFTDKDMTAIGYPSQALEILDNTDKCARISFRQPVADAGFVDAGWWPRSRDLTVELPPLLGVLWTACRDVNRVSYNLAFWDPAPRRLCVEGRLVRLGGYRRQSPLLLGLIDSAGREHIDVLVIPPETDVDVAERALALSGGVGSVESPQWILDLAAAPIREAVN
jgi:hypothetical protein